MTDEVLIEAQYAPDSEGNLHCADPMCRAPLSAEGIHHSAACIDSRTLTAALAAPAPTAEWVEAMALLRKWSACFNHENCLSNYDSLALDSALATLTAIHTADRAEAKAQEALAFAAGAEEGRAWAATEIARLTADVERLRRIEDAARCYTAVDIAPSWVSAKDYLHTLTKARERLDAALSAEEER